MRCPTLVDSPDLLPRRWLEDKQGGFVTMADKKQKEKRAAAAGSMRAMFGRRHGGSRGGDAASANSGRSGRSGGYSASAGSGAEQSSIQLDQTSACTSWTEDGEEDGTRSAFVAATNPAPAVLAADEASVEHLQRERTRSTLRDRAREAGKALDDPTQEPAARHAHPAAPRLAASRAAARVHGDASANSNPEPCGALGDVPAAHSASAHNTSVLAGDRGGRARPCAQQRLAVRDYLALQLE